MDDERQKSVTLPVSVLVVIPISMRSIGRVMWV